MGKIIRWIETVIAGNHPYASMAGVDIKKGADKLFESESTEKKKENSPNPSKTSPH